MTFYPKGHIQASIAEPLDLHLQAAEREDRLKRATNLIMLKRNLNWADAQKVVADEGAEAILADHEKVAAVQEDGANE